MLLINTTKAALGYFTYLLSVYVAEQQQQIVSWLAVEFFPKYQR